MTRPNDAEHSELTALADGTLSGRRRRRLEERVASEPGLRAELERQRLAVAALRSSELAAPAGLRARIEAERERARRRRGCVHPGAPARPPPVAPAHRRSSRPPSPPTCRPPRPPPRRAAQRGSPPPPSACPSLTGPTSSAGGRPACAATRSTAA